MQMRVREGSKHQVGFNKASAPGAVFQLAETGVGHGSEARI
jgi:hypothetical protein